MSAQSFLSHGFSLLIGLIIGKRRIWPPRTLVAQDVQKIVLIRSDHLGDFILSVPAILSVRKAYPQAEIIVLANRAYHAVLESVLPDHNMTLWHSQKGVRHLVGVWWRLVHSHVDVSLDLCHGDTLAYALVCFFAAIPIRIGYDVGRHGALFTYPLLLRDANVRFESDIALQAAFSLTGIVTRQQAKPQCAASLVSRWEEALALRGIGKDSLIFGFNIGVSALNPIKAWPIRYVAELMQCIHRDYPDCAMIVLGTPEEKDYMRALEACIQHPVHSFVGKTTVADAMCLLSLCDLFIANNTGLMQLSVFLDTPTVVLNGPSSVTRWGPENTGRHTIIRKDLACNIVDCDGADCDIDFFCMQGLLPEAVYPTVKQRISKLYANTEKKETHGIYTADHE